MTEPRQLDALGASIRESAGGRAASWLARAASRAWSSSRSRELVVPAAGAWSALSPAQKIRTSAIVGVVAMLVDRAMTLVRARPSDPLSAVLPIGVLVLCVAVAAFAEPLARVSERLGR